MAKRKHEAKDQHDLDICKYQRAAATVGRVKNGFGKKVNREIPDDSWQNLIASWHTYPHEAQSRFLHYLIKLSTEVTVKWRKLKLKRQ